MYPYRDRLSFQFEYILNREPLRIDAVIIKKEPGAIIDNPIGAIFRRVNIVEYKSPGDRLSTSDFHQVNAYGRLYSVLNKVETKDMTLSFVATAHPRKLLDYLGKEYRFAIREGPPGIYYVEEGTFTVQIIESKRLEGVGEGIGLKDLRGGLNGDELWEILEKSRKLPKGAPLSAYLNTLAAANRSGLRGMLKVANEDVVVEVLEEFGVIDKWKAVARNKVREELREEVREEVWQELREEIWEEVRKVIGEKDREIVELRQKLQDKGATGL